jgi:hypothetical protein
VISTVPCRPTNDFTREPGEKELAHEVRTGVKTEEIRTARSCLFSRSRKLKFCSGSRARVRTYFFAGDLCSSGLGIVDAPK